MVICWLVAQLGGEPVSDTTQSLPVSCLLPDGRILAHILNSEHPSSRDYTSAEYRESSVAEHTVYPQDEIDPLLPRILDNQPHSQ